MLDFARSGPGRGAAAARPGGDGPPPFEVLRPRARARLLLVCDHASRAVPPALAGLGLAEADLRRHIAWDIGAADVTRELSRLLDAPAVLAGWSRLVIDANRLPGDATSIPCISDGTVIPGNRGLAPADRTARADALFRPYHREIADRLARLRAAGADPALVSMHSFTPVMRGQARPWQVAVLWGHDPRLALPLIARLRREGLTVGDNEPYSGRSGYGYSIARHGTANGLRNALVEVRQDLVDTPRGAADWAALLARAFADVLPGDVPGAGS